jgi:histidinol-phosphate/aromatic aminotransferase/cobyric acid decarboxylase-like protein
MVLKAAPPLNVSDESLEAFTRALVDEAYIHFSATATPSTDLVAAVASWAP